MLTVQDVASILTSLNPLPRRTFGLPDSMYGTNEWRTRRLVANILVGNSRDVSAVRATDALFDRFTIDQLADPTFFNTVRKTIADFLEQEFDIKYGGKKANYVHETLLALKERFDGQVPDTMEELTSFPGVGRHAASVVLALAFDKPAFGVDLHVRRISKRLGLVDKKATDKVIEKVFMEVENPGHLSRAFVQFGAKYCTFHPKCSKCPLNGLCKYDHSKKKDRIF